MDNNLLVVAVARMSVDAEHNPTTQLGIRVKVVRTEARVAPSLTHVNTDTVDFYVIEVTWRQSFYGEVVGLRGLLELLLYVTH